MFYVSGDIHGCVADVIHFCKRNELKADDTILPKLLLRLKMQLKNPLQRL